MNVFVYPPVHIPAEELVSNWTMVNFSPSSDLCEGFYQQQDLCGAKVECSWCETSNECLPYMEVHRPENGCFQHLQDPGIFGEKKCLVELISRVTRNLL